MFSSSDVLNKVGSLFADKHTERDFWVENSKLKIIGLREIRVEEVKLINLNLLVLVVVWKK